MLASSYKEEEKGRVEDKKRGHPLRTSQAEEGRNIREGPFKYRMTNAAH